MARTSRWMAVRSSDMEDTFASLLEHQFAKRAHGVAVVYRGSKFTYGGIATRVRNVQALLHAQRMERGDRVILYTTEKFPLLILHLGVMLSGGVSVPLNPNFTEDEMRYFLVDSGARFAFVSPREAPLLRRLQDECPSLSQVIEHGRDATFAVDDAAPEISLELDDPCFMLYSSGTTGRPKGILHTHGNVALSLRALQQWWRCTPDDVILNVLPLHHLHGLSFAAHLSLITGSIMLLEDSFLTTMDRLREATVFMGIPTMYGDLLRRSEFRTRASQWSRMRLYTCGSAPIRSELLTELEAILEHPIVNRYGMTETHVITSLPIDGVAPHGAVGLPIGGIDLKLVAEDGSPIAPGVRHADGTLRVGEVLVRSANLFQGYWNMPAATEDAYDADGFFKTGDLGVLDPQGSLTLYARKSDLIIVDGENVYPAIVERVLNAFPQVRESAVIGVPDARHGERVVAFVVSSAPLDVGALRRHCAEQLVHFQQPKAFIGVAELPRNTMGKVLKLVLRERFVQEMNALHAQQ